MSASWSARRDRSRLRCVVAVLAAIALGLASRRHPGLVPSFVGKYPGDVLWASMVFFGWGAVVRRASTGRVASLAGATAIAIECLKLWSSPWWSGVRQSTVGHLVFGHVFSWRNLVAYAAGVLVACAFDDLLQRRNHRHVPDRPSRD